METKKLTNEEFAEIFESIRDSRTMIPSEALLSILAGIVRTSDKDAEDIKNFAEAVKDCTLEDVVSKTVLFTCNSVVLNIWKIFGEQIREACKKCKEPEETESAA